MTLKTVVAGILFATSCITATSAQGAIKHSIDIPAQELGSALVVLARQTHIQVVYPADLVHGRNTVAVSGSMTPEAALDTLLARTGLKYEFLDEQTVTLSAMSGSTSKAPPVLPVRLEMQGMRESRDEGPEGFGTQLRLAQLDQGKDSGASAVGRSSDSTERSARADSLEEIIVTAQKREESLAEVPVPVTVLQAADLSDRSQFHLRDYFSKVPGLSLTSSESGPAIAIRGVISSGGNNPVVGIILDETPLGSSTSIGGGYYAPDLDPADLARIEVLRGPQGTLYGASSVGGLLKYVTVDPSTDGVSGRVQLGLNTVDQSGVGYNASGNVNVPLGSTFAIRLSGFDRHEAGFIDNVRSSVKNVNEADISGGRFSGLWHPTEDLSIKFGVLYQYHDLAGWPFVTQEPGVGDLQQSLLPDAGTSNTTFNAYNLNVDYKIGDVELASITGYSTTRTRSRFDYKGFLLDLAQAFYTTDDTLQIDDNETRKFTQELRLSTAITEQMDLLAGVYYTRESSPWDSETFAANPDGTFIGSVIRTTWESSFEEKAVFANLTYHFTERFDVQIGGRHSDIKQSFEEVDSGIALEPDSPSIVPKDTFSESASTYLLTPRWKLTDDLMVYARFASGYRPGGINAGAISGLDESRPFKPDETRNYEIGIKGSALDNRLSFDASLYLIDWDDIQLLITNPDTGLGYFDNGSSARSQGVELAVQYAPIRQLRFDAWIAWNEAKLAQDMPLGAAVGFNGDRLPFSARLSANTAVAYQFQLGELTSTVGGNVSYVGDRLGDFLTADPSPRQKFSSYTQVDLNAGVAWDLWSVDFYANNVTDQRGIVGGGKGTLVEAAFQVIQPRTFGVSLSRDFD